MRMWVAVVALCLPALVVLTGCDQMQSAMVQVGIADPELPPPNTVDVICDASVGSTCTRETLYTSLGSVLQYAGRRPGSTVRLWVLGMDFANSALVGEQVSTRPARKGPKIYKAHIERWTESVREYFLKAAEPFISHPGNTRSPIAEGISKVAIYGSPGGVPRVILLISDAREVSGFGDFECGTLPTADTFTGKAHQAGVLAPGSLTNARFLFAYVTEGEVQGHRCAFTVARAAKIRRLWEEALRRAGATQISIGSGPPALSE